MKHILLTLSGYLLLPCSVRRSSTKKSEFLTKRYSQPQLETTGHEFTCTTNHPHHRQCSTSSTSLSVSPTTISTATQHVRSDAKLGGLETVGGNNCRPYLNRRSQLYRFSCDDYRSGDSDTLAFDDTCRLGSGDTAVSAAAGVAAASAATTTNTMQSDTASQSPPPPPPSRPSSSSSTSSSTAQNRCHTEHAGTELVPTNAIVDLATDNLPGDANKGNKCVKLSATTFVCLFRFSRRYSRRM